MKKLVLTALFMMASASFALADGKALYAKCIACHGAQGQNKALGQSQIIKGWDKAKTIKALAGYKDGSYGGAMKGVMKGQVASYTDAQIDEVSAYIASF